MRLVVTCALTCIWTTRLLGSETDDQANDKNSPPWHSSQKVLNPPCQAPLVMYAAYLMTPVYLTQCDLCGGKSFHEYKQPWGLYLVCWGVSEIIYSTWQMSPWLLQHLNAEQREVTVVTASRPRDGRCVKALQFVPRSTADWKFTSPSAVTLCCQMTFCNAIYLHL